MKKFAALILIFIVIPVFSVVDESPIYNVVCIGSPCLDLLLQVSEQSLKSVAPEKGGSRPVDYHTFTSILKNCGVKPKISIGGSGINVIRALAHLGQSCGYVGKVGSYEAPTIFRELTRLKIDALLLETATPTTRVCCLVTPDGQRTMRVFLGASNEALDINDIRFDCFEKTQHVHLEGYLLYVNDGQFLKQLIKKAKENGATVSLDCASYEVVARYKKIIMHLLEKGTIDIVFANEDEIQMLTGYGPERGCKELKKLCKIAVVTAGKKGCWAANDSEIIQSPGIPTKAVDTTGAGDFFVAGFLHGYLTGKNLQTCAYYGNVLGKSAVEVLGTQLPARRWQELKLIM